MKNYEWAKGYKYAKISIYRVNFWKIRLFKKGYIKRRTGVMIIKKHIYNLYLELLGLKGDI